MEDLRADFHPGMSRKRLRKKKNQERNVNNLIEYKNGVELWFLLAYWRFRPAKLADFMAY